MNDGPGTRLTEQGWKGIQLTDEERLEKWAQTERYKRWRYTVGGGAYVTDVDQCEWRAFDGVMRVVATLELTCWKHIDRMPPQRYLDSIIERFYDTNNQAALAYALAQQLGVSCWIVLFRDFTIGTQPDLFWIHEIRAKTPTPYSSAVWSRLNRIDMIRWLQYELPESYRRRQGTSPKWGAPRR